MNFLKHCIYVGRTFFKFHKYKLQNFRQVSKLSDKFFSGHGATGDVPELGIMVIFSFNGSCKLIPSQNEPARMTSQQILV